MDGKTENKKATKHTQVIVDTLPVCDFCGNHAAYDGKTQIGPWANMCDLHFTKHGIGLGLGKGQKLIMKKEKEKIADHNEGSLRRKLNDKFRQSLGLMGNGRVLITSGVNSLPDDTRTRILLAVRDFDDFNEDNDPYGEHDFASLKVDGHRIFWKIDTYDAEYRFYGEVNRVLTIMLAHEY